MMTTSKSEGEGKIPLPTLFRGWKGFAIPNHETKPYLRPLHWMDAERQIKELVPHKGVCVQAGGNWGFWPFYLADMFETVYTFEPDPRCFTALTMNTATKDNVVKFQAALGVAHGLVDLEREEDNTGSQKVMPGGIFPTLAIDDLGLTSCDLIYLDVEGKEKDAIFGATATIAEHKPIVAFEHRDKVDPNNDALKAMAWHRYKEIGRSGHDIIMGPA